VGRFYYWFEPDVLRRSRSHATQITAPVVTLPARRARYRTPHSCRALPPRTHRFIAWRFTGYRFGVLVPVVVFGYNTFCGLAVVAVDFCLVPFRFVTHGLYAHDLARTCRFGFFGSQFCVVGVVCAVTFRLFMPAPPTVWDSGWSSPPLQPRTTRAPRVIPVAFADPFFLCTIHHSTYFGLFYIVCAVIFTYSTIYSDKFSTCTYGSPHRTFWFAFYAHGLTVGFGCATHTWFCHLHTPHTLYHTGCGLHTHYHAARDGGLLRHHTQHLPTPAPACTTRRRTAHACHCRCLPACRAAARLLPACRACLPRWFDL